jgi:hypothetical protein
MTIEGRVNRGEVCKSAERFHPHLSYVVLAASQQQSAVPIGMALHDRHHKNEAFKWIQFGHRVNFTFSLCMGLLFAPDIAFLAFARRRRRHNLDRVLDQAAPYPGSGPVLEHRLFLESFFDRVNKTLFRFLVVCRQQECEEIQRLGVVSEYVAKVSMIREVGPEACDLRFVRMKHESPYRHVIRVQNL